jgi:hypothetical protein
MVLCYTAVYSAEYSAVAGSGGKKEQEKRHEKENPHGQEGSRPPLYSPLLLRLLLLL